MRLDRFTLICLLTGALGAGAAAATLAVPRSAPPRIEAPAPAGPPAVNGAALSRLAARLAPPAQEAPAAARQPAVGLTLIGLVRNDAGRLAVLSDGARTYTARAGDTVVGHDVLAVDEASVVLSSSSGEVTLRLGAP